MATNSVGPANWLHDHVGGVAGEHLELAAKHCVVGDRLQFQKQPPNRLLDRAVGGLLINALVIACDPVSLAAS